MVCAFSPISLRLYMYMLSLLCADEDIMMMITFRYIFYLTIRCTSASWLSIRSRHPRQLGKPPTWHLTYTEYEPRKRRLGQWTTPQPVFKKRWEGVKHPVTCNIVTWLKHFDRNILYMNVQSPNDPFKLWNSSISQFCIRKLKATYDLFYCILIYFNFICFKCSCFIVFEV